MPAPYPDMNAIKSAITAGATFYPGGAMLVEGVVKRLLLSSNVWSLVAPETSGAVRFVGEPTFNLIANGTILSDPEGEYYQAIDTSAGYLQLVQTSSTRANLTPT